MGISGEWRRDYVTGAGGRHMVPVALACLAERMRGVPNKKRLKYNRDSGSV